MTAREAQDFIDALRIVWPDFAASDLDEWLGIIARSRHDVAIEATKELTAREAPPTIADWQAASRDAWNVIRPKDTPADPDAPTRITPEKHAAAIAHAREVLHATPSPFIPKPIDTPTRKAVGS